MTHCGGKERLYNYDISDKRVFFYNWYEFEASLMYEDLYYDRWICELTYGNSSFRFPLDSHFINSSMDYQNSRILNAIKNHIWSSRKNNFVKFDNRSLFDKIVDDYLF